MQILRNIDELRKWRKENIKEGQNLGYVATMGALHDGHLSLISHSKKDNDKTIVSIFVNPTQFGANEDFDKYPRDEQKDIALCQNALVDAIFLPHRNDMYPSDDEIKILPPHTLSSKFEGALRQGHFDGVLQVVSKFFHLIKPTNAYFGKKDTQQLLIIKQMVQSLFWDIHIIGCPIMRDSNGLALSSRNIYLDKNAYNEALKIPQAINLVKEAFVNGKSHTDELEHIAKVALNGLEIDYCNIVNMQLEPIKYAESSKSILLIAVRVGGVRLLDNYWF